MNTYKFNKLIILILFFLHISILGFAGPSEESPTNLGMGLTLGAGSEGPDLDICPIGVKVITNFLQAWKVDDYDTMYSLIDDSFKKDYTLREAKMDFQFIEFKEYTISRIRQIGQNFEFFLSYGDWKYGDKLFEDEK